MPALRRLLHLGLLAVLAALLAAGPAAAQVVDDPRKPLVYVFSVDGLDGDAVDAITAPFLTSLIDGEGDGRATYYEESRSVITAETNTNHVAMATGAFGRSSGNPGNSFAVYDEGSKAACDGDLATGSGAETGSDSPDDGDGDGGDGGEPSDEIGDDPEQVDGEEPSCVLAETFFQALERQAGPGLTTAGIFGKPKLAAIFASSQVADEGYDADFLYTPCTPPFTDNEPYCKGAGRVPDGYAFTDDQVMDEVILSVDEGVPADGRTKRPNLTFVNLPSVDSTGHGTGGPDLSGAYQAAVRLADTELRRFVENQKARGLWERTTMFVVSDHTMDTTRAGSTPIGPVLEANPETRGKFLVVNNGSVDMVYLRDRTAPEAEREEALRDARRTVLLERPAVDEALYREPNSLDPGTEDEPTTLDGAHPEWRIAGPRTGDLYVTASDGFAFDAAGAALTGNHGNPYTSDNFFLVASGGEQVRQQRLGGVRGDRFDDTAINRDQAQNPDVGPSVMALLGCRPLRDADPAARVLDEAFTSFSFDGCRPPAPDDDGDGDGDGSASAKAPEPAAPAPTTAGSARPDVACSIPQGLRKAAVRPARGGRLQLALARTRAARGPVRVDVFQQSLGRRVIGNRLVRRFRRARSFSWSGRGVRDGHVLVRIRVRLADGTLSERRVALVRRGGRFVARPPFERAPTCRLLVAAKLEAPVFGGAANRDLSIAFRLQRSARVGVRVLDGRRVVRRFGTTTRAGALTHRLRLAAEGLPRGRDLVVRIEAVAGAERVVERLTVRRL